MNIKQILSPNKSSILRKKSTIKYIILHYTGMQSTRESLERLTSKKSKVSCHYLISEKGRIYQIVDENRTAWHAGKSRWKDDINLNSKSIGIELSNKGHNIDYKNYPNKQLKCLLQLLKYLIKKYNISIYNILGHSDVAPLRKKDPGEKFPWLSILKILYPKKKLFNQNVINKITLQKSKKNYRDLFFKNLKKIGYRYFLIKKRKPTDIKVIKAFQRRYRQDRVDGKIDTECLKISSKIVKISKNA